MPEQKAKALSEMAIAEKGFCNVKAYYEGPERPVWELPDLPSLTTKTFLLDSDFYLKRSPQATLYVKRVPTGYVVGLPDPPHPIPQRAGHPQIPLPVVGEIAIPPE